MIRSEFMSALKQVATERGISADEVIETLKRAMIAAYRKDYPGESVVDEDAGEEIRVDVDKKTGEVRLFKDDTDVTPPGFGRIAAQTAKQVILQGVREAEKVAVIDEFRGKVGKVLPGMMQRIERGSWIVDIGRASALMPKEEQVYNENYQHGRRLKVLVKRIEEGELYHDIIVSRTDPNLIKSLFQMEVPEVQNGAVEIKEIAREVGSRTKIAVASTQEGVDPVGSMVGQRGVRVQAVTEELNGEKMDIILWSSSPESFIINALAPAHVVDVTLDHKRKTAVVEVQNDQLSLAIGKDGQNVRLASKLAGFKIDIVGDEDDRLKSAPEKKTDQTEVSGSDLASLGLSTRTIKSLAKSGITTIDELKLMDQEQIETTPGIGPKSVEEIVKALK